MAKAKTWQLGQEQTFIPADVPIKLEPSADVEAPAEGEVESIRTASARGRTIEISICPRTEDHCLYPSSLELIKEISSTHDIAYA